jgi:hypothetical protein
MIEEKIKMIKRLIKEDLSILNYELNKLERDITMTNSVNELKYLNDKVDKFMKSVIDLKNLIKVKINRI